MKKRILFLIFIIGLLSLLSLTQRGQFNTPIDNTTIPFQTCEIGSTPENPRHLELNKYYEDWSSYFANYDIMYMDMNLTANEIYFIFHEPTIWYSIELYDDPNFTIFLGTAYSVPAGQIMREYLLFSPNRTGLYYLKMYCSSSIATPRLAILVSVPYIINTTELVLISQETRPICIYQADLLEGEYKSSQGVLYAPVQKGWNYVILECAYGTTPTEEPFNLVNGSYAFIIEESCQFQITYFPKQNETLPEEPPENTTDTGSDPDSFLNGVTPIFGVGVIIGVLVLFKLKKN
ncbi:MAG: hypothetical protein ACTSQI_15130 [Candidatus Helarchaeota archaeon]